MALAAATVATSLALFDGTVVTVALPEMQRELGLSLQAQEWVVQAYLLVPIGLLPVAGLLADNVGRRRIFVFGMTLFAAASLLCAVAPDAGALLAGRALQGAAVGLLIPASVGLLSSAGGHRREQNRAVMLWTSWSALAMGAGPLLGGLLAGGPGWRSFFWLTFAAAVPTLLVARNRLDESRDPHARSIGWTSAAIAIAATGLTAVGLGLLPSEGLGSPLALGCLIAGAVATTALIVRQRSEEKAFVPPIMLTHPTFRATVVLSGIVYGAMYGALFFVSLYLQQALHLSSIEAGLALAPFALGLVLAGPPAEALALKRGPRLPTTAGCLIAGAALIAIALTRPTTPILIVAATVAGAGLGIAAGPLMAAVVGSVERRRAAIATGVSSAASRAAAIAGVAALTLIGSLAFSHSFESKGIDAGLRHATEKRAFAAARVLERNGEQGRVLASARNATEDSFRLIAGAAGLALLAGAAFSAVALGTPAPDHTGEMPVTTTPSPLASALQHGIETIPVAGPWATHRRYADRRPPQMG